MYVCMHACMNAMQCDAMRCDCMSCHVMSCMYVISCNVYKKYFTMCICTKVVDRCLLLMPGPKFCCQINHPDKLTRNQWCSSIPIGG